MHDFCCLGFVHAVLLCVLEEISNNHETKMPDMNLIHEQPKHILLFAVARKLLLLGAIGAIVATFVAFLASTVHSQETGLLARKLNLNADWRFILSLIHI